MTDHMRAMLDELMGKDRDKPPASRQNRPAHFSDPEICKYYICGFCPHDLFINTKSDLGNCTKVHDDICKEEFQRLEWKKKQSYPYERDWVRFLDRMIDDLDRKIKKGIERVDTQNVGTPEPTISPQAKLRIDEIDTKISRALKQVEQLAEQGRVDESQKLMTSIEGLKSEKEQIILNENRAVNSAEKRMKVCEICGAFLVVGDTEKRTASHLEGKQHIGFELIRKTTDQWKKRDREERDRAKFEAGLYGASSSSSSSSRDNSDRDRNHDSRRRSPGRYDDRKRDRRKDDYERGDRKRRH